MKKHWFTAYLTSHYSKGKNLGLDLGSGYNNWKEFYSTKWIGLDLPNRLQASKEKSPTVCGDGAHLPFSDNSFSFLSCYSVLLYVNDLKSVINEIHRVLRPDGIAVIIIQNPKGQITEDPKNIINHLDNKSLNQFLTLNKFKSIKYRNLKTLLFSTYYNLTSVYAYAIVSSIKEIKNE